MHFQNYIFKIFLRRSKALVFERVSVCITEWETEKPFKLIGKFSRSLEGDSPPRQRVFERATVARFRIKLKVIWFDVDDDIFWYIYFTIVSASQFGSLCKTIRLDFVRQIS